MPRPKGWVFLRPYSRPPIELVPFLWNRVRQSNIIWNLPVSIRRRIFRLSIRSAAPYHLAYPGHGRQYIDGIPREPPAEVTANWPAPEFPFDLNALPPLPMIKSKNRLRRVFRCPELAEALSASNREARIRKSWKAYDGVGDKLLNRASSLAVYRAVLKGIPSPTPNLLSSNNTLAYLSVAYRLHYGLRYYKELEMGQLPMKIAADMFEAYIGALHRELYREHRSHLLLEWFKKLHDPSVWPDWTTHSSAQRWRDTPVRAKQATKSIQRMRFIAQRGPGSVVRGLAYASGVANRRPNTTYTPYVPASRIARIISALMAEPGHVDWRRYETSGTEQEVDALFAGFCKEDEEACLARWEERHGPALAPLPVVCVQSMIPESKEIMRLDEATKRIIRVERQIKRALRDLRKIKHLERLAGKGRL